VAGAVTNAQRGAGQGHHFQQVREIHPHPRPLSRGEGRKCNPGLKLRKPLSLGEGLG
jgi:hypothetical protein